MERSRTNMDSLIEWVCWLKRFVYYFEGCPYLSSLCESAQKNDCGKVGNRGKIHHGDSMVTLNQTSVNPDFTITFERLLELTKIDPDLDEDQEDEVLNPSDYAFSSAMELLTQLYKLLGPSFPRGFSSLESRGGVNLIWNNQDFDKEVRVKIPVSPQFQGSVYYRKGDDSKLIKSSSLEPIYQCLLWLPTNESINRF